MWPRAGSPSLLAGEQGTLRSSLRYFKQPACIEAWAKAAADAAKAISPIVDETAKTAAARRRGLALKADEPAPTSPLRASPPP
jgi:hypothetical protein